MSTATGAEAPIAEKIDSSAPASQSLTLQELAVLKQELATSRRGKMRPVRGPKSLAAYYIR